MRLAPLPLSLAAGLLVACAPTVDPSGVRVVLVGVDGATFDLGEPIVESCGGSVTVSNDAPAIFPPGDTTVTWTIESGDDSETDTQIVTVTGFNDAIVQVEVSGGGTGTFTRCLRVEFNQCPDGDPIVIEQEFTFVNGTATGLRTCMSATSCMPR